MTQPIVYRTIDELVTEENTIFLDAEILNLTKLKSSWSRLNSAPAFSKLSGDCLRICMADMVYLAELMYMPDADIVVTPKNYERAKSFQKWFIEKFKYLKNGPELQIQDNYSRGSRDYRKKLFGDLRFMHKNICRLAEHSFRSFPLDKELFTYFELITSPSKKPSASEEIVSYLLYNSLINNKKSSALTYDHFIGDYLTDAVESLLQDNPSWDVKSRLSNNTISVYYVRDDNKLATMVSSSELIG